MILDHYHGHLVIVSYRYSSALVVSCGCFYSSSLPNHLFEISCSIEFQDNLHSLVVSHYFKVFKSRSHALPVAGSRRVSTCDAGTFSIPLLLYNLENFKKVQFNFTFLLPAFLASGSYVLAC